MLTEDLVSIIIPARNELFLYKTLKDLLAKAKGNIEIITVLDGYWPRVEELADLNDPRINFLHFSESKGMREGINLAAAIAKGKYLMKVDAHVMISEGFDLVLKENHLEDNWITIPRRKRLDAENWTIQNVGKPDIDYEFVSSPSHDGAKGAIWTERILERLDKPQFDIDENMTFQGSCWFMTNNHYNNRLAGMNDPGYGTFVREAQEIGLKTWLGGGKVMINKRLWYAHLHKGRTYGRMYHLDKHKMERGNKYCDEFWFGNKPFDGRRYDLAWLIERFWPVPSWTPELVDSVRQR